MTESHFKDNKKEKLLQAYSVNCWVFYMLMYLLALLFQIISGYVIFKMPYPPFFCPGVATSNQLHY